MKVHVNERNLPVEIIVLIKKVNLLGKRALRYTSRCKSLSHIANQRYSLSVHQSLTFVYLLGKHNLSSGLYIYFQHLKLSIATNKGVCLLLIREGSTTIVFSQISGNSRYYLNLNF